MTTVIRAPRPGVLTVKLDGYVHQATPNCWCHPTFRGPWGATRVGKDGQIVNLAHPPLNQPTLIHQDPLGAALNCLAGVFVWHSEKPMPKGQ